MKKMKEIEIKRQREKKEVKKTLQHLRQNFGSKCTLGVRSLRNAWFALAINDTNINIAKAMRNTHQTK